MIKAIQNLFKAVGRKKTIDIRANRLLQMNRKLSFTKGK